MDDRAGVDVWTLAALGVLAFVSQTLLHEAVGHGTVCLLTGGRIALIAPFFMRCTVVAWPTVAAGPAMNILAGLLCYLFLRGRPGKANTFRYGLWLALMFNWLVAAGYLLVGAATGFGDWSVLFGSIRPVVWRLPAAIAAIGFYIAALNVGGRVFFTMVGADALSAPLRLRLFLLPAGAAAMVAVAAQLYGQGGDLLELALALGSTLVVGLTMLSIERGPKKISAAKAALAIPFSPPVIGTAVFVALAFILAIGPGLALAPH